MRIELLISALCAKPEELIRKMNIKTDAVLIDQCDEDGEESSDVNGHTVKVFKNRERGVGKSRNLALSKASADLVLFSDDDLVYNDDYEEAVLKEFEGHPEADGIFFNFEVDESRRTYHTEEFGPVKITASGRYPTYSLCIKLDKVKEKELSFSPLFGGGAKYSCGEDSLFIMSALKAGLRLYRSPVCLGREVLRKSTWFEGYTDKFFFDKGVLYHFLYKKAAYPIAVRFILKHKKTMCVSIPPHKALSLMAKGIKEGKSINSEVV
ncbi:MAG: glycosyltransferase family 2 protein [Lachnospiraceae bacterium]|nr:glycosyltransferase family 2 protein [Lachnospiraceae bacterium]MBO7599710.1 glycosyltransferase family 2 protein [Lachnospiraceae bacterium]